MEALLSGILFGAALAAGGLASPAVVDSQMALKDWYLIQCLLSATILTAVVYALLDLFDLVKLQPRSSSPLGAMATYGGNMLGGALLGAGMATSSSGPEILLAQAGCGIHQALYVLAGAVTGGILWTGFLADLTKRIGGTGAGRPKTVTLSQYLGIPRNVVLLIVGGLWIMAGIYLPDSDLGAQGGLSTVLVGASLIGLSQTFSMLSRRALIGISGSYEEAGMHFWWIVGGAQPTKKPRSQNNLIFAAGLLLGAACTAQLAPSLVHVAKGGEVSKTRAAIGGALMTIGSRMAGGCTAGHGLSGLALLSTSSLITMTFAFATGPLVKYLIG
ncbi:hypothetical protein B0I35DRAFT_473100 [Stachybotrys elegans]|uniref:Sulphur transport domain-containing protein n=1 Tax=Stachybotrys elegans TaxID=80388 RepID=A0A8K0WXD7_9HYPO|nr:hypothetical protein B0I35DRAFT_473100 [Stachybotrys elegans]